LLFINELSTGRVHKFPAKMFILEKFKKM